MQNSAGPPQANLAGRQASGKWVRIASPGLVFDGPEKGSTCSEILDCASVRYDRVSFETETVANDNFVPFALAA